jgi:catechol 2,3-dioxygenase-like lactoylglutathione lyase family enzyme
MNKAVKFYRDILGLRLKFESPGWSEFVTGETTFALHPASDKNPGGKVEWGFTVADVEAFSRDMSAKSVLFSMPSQEAGLRRSARAVRRFRGRTLQRGCGAGIVAEGRSCHIRLFEQASR